MEFEFREMTQKEAEEIAFNWHYEGEYPFYAREADEEDWQSSSMPLSGKEQFLQRTQKVLSPDLSVLPTRMPKPLSLVLDCGRV